MNKIFLYILFCILFIGKIYSVEIHDYQYEIIGHIKIGINEGELGKDTGEMPGIAPNLPGPLSISNDNKIYIFDDYNQRFNIYNLDITFLNSINTKYETIGIEIAYVYKMKFDVSNNLFIITAGYPENEFIVIQNKDNSISKIDIKNNNETREVFSRYNFFPMHNGILYHTKSNIKFMEYSNSKYIDKQVQNYLILNTKSKNIVFEETVKLINLHAFVNENKLAMNGNRLLTTNKQHWIKYYDFIKKNLSTKELKNSIEIDRESVMKTFLGFDNSDNVYWRGYIDGIICVTVFNVYGEIIDCFEYLKPGVPSIAPNGDVYCMENDDKNVTVYKITRQW